MASIWKHPKSKFWTACYTDSDGRQRKASTKTTDKEKAIEIAQLKEDAHASANGRAAMAQQLQALFPQFTILNKPNRNIVDADEMLSNINEGPAREIREQISLNDLIGSLVEVLGQAGKSKHAPA